MFSSVCFTVAFVLILWCIDFPCGSSDTSLSETLHEDSSGERGLFLFIYLLLFFRGGGGGYLLYSTTHLCILKKFYSGGRKGF